jgi:hypothetical protein
MDIISLLLGFGSGVVVTLLLEALAIQALFAPVRDLIQSLAAP